MPRWSYIRVRMDHTVVVGIYKGASTEPCNSQDEQYGGISYPSCLYLSRKYLGLPDGEITHQDVVQHQASKIVISFWMNPTAMARIIDP